MYPVLFHVPLPQAPLPLRPLLLALAIVAGLLAAYGLLRRRRDLAFVSGVLSIAGGIAAFAIGGAHVTLGPIPIYSYGALLASSLALGWYLSLWLAARDGLPKVTVANCYFWTAVSALAGARLLYVLTNLPEFTSPLSWLDFRGGGLVAYGGFVGGAVGSYVYLRRRGLPLLPWADVAIPSVALGLCLTRIGCYLFGCDFGKPLQNGAPGWLRDLGTFPRWHGPELGVASGSPAWLEHVSHRGLSFDAPESLPVHPTQLYEASLGLLLFGLALLLRRKRPFAGAAFLCVGFVYAVGRFGLELLRDDVERGFLGPALPGRMLVGAALTVFAVSYAFGPARAVGVLAARWTRVAAARWASVAVLAGLFAAFVTAIPQSPFRLSTSQVLAVLSALAIAAAWPRRTALALSPA